jgi:hypothetical protein
MSKALDKKNRSKHNVCRGETCCIFRSAGATEAAGCTRKLTREKEGWFLDMEGFLPCARLATGPDVLCRSIVGGTCLPVGLPPTSLESCMSRCDKGQIKQPDSI